MPEIRISCPRCDWEPDDACRWVCTVCNTHWNTFETRGVCPACGKVHEETQCFRRKGGCGEVSPHADWYEETEVANNQPSSSWSFRFWENKDELPVTPADKEWTERALVLLCDTLEGEYVQSLPTITPEKKYFDRKFKGTEQDAEFIFGRMINLMAIDAWELELKFYSNKPAPFSEGIVATPSPQLHGPWVNPTMGYVDNGYGQKEVWIDMDILNDPERMVAVLAPHLAQHKLWSVHRMAENDKLLAALAAVVFGFGIFTGNAYFHFNQWTYASRRGWKMRRSGYLPEQVIAYAMAWLAVYKGEDIAWKSHLSRTIKKYFEQSYNYIQSHWEDFFGD